MFRILLVLMSILVFSGAFAQPISGSWQVVKDSQCLTEEMGTVSEAEEELLESMASMAGTVPKTIFFNTNGTGEENWRSRGKKKPSSKSQFLYRYSNGTLYFLDKKSRLITGIYIVEEITQSSLIIFNKERSCERIEFLRVN
jgi:hypothetical protein